MSPCATLFDACFCSSCVFYALNIKSRSLLAVTKLIGFGDFLKFKG